LRRRGYVVEVRNAPFSQGRDIIEDAGEYDAIIGTTRAGALLGAMAKLRHGTPLIVDHIDPIRQFHDTEPPWLSYPVHAAESAVFRLADHVCWVTADDSPRVRRWGRRYTQTALGVDFDAFARPTPEAVDAAASRLSGLALRSRVAVYIGGLEPIYNLEALLDGMRAAERWSLLVLGEGSLEQDIEAAAKADDSLHYLGSVPHEHVPGYLHHADVGVCLADERTVKVLEYAAARLPVVHVNGTAADRFGELVQHVRLDARSIAGGLDDAANWPSGRLDEMQRHARDRDWERVTEAYDLALAEVLG